MREHGQALVEFALVFPIFILLLLALIEFSFVFNASLGVNFASRDASLIAAEAGSGGLSDCVILQKIEGDLRAPIDRSLIQTVTIFKADRAGKPVSPVAQMVYTRSGSMPCSFATGTVTLPYTLQGSGSYAASTRCDQLAGCPVSPPTTPATYRPLDSIGVTILYRYHWHTPLRNLLPFLPGAATGYFDLTWSNVMRMEPIL
ncbi:MAG: TadE family protein [Candidatus Limnocylindrales bacterium]